MLNYDLVVCLAIPGKIIEIDQNKEHATVDYGDGTKRKANISLVDVKKVITADQMLRLDLVYALVKNGASGIPGH